jgi:hypothetical protein
MLLFRAMNEGSFNNPTPQFGTAEYVGSPGGDHCQYCHQPIAGIYYRLNDAMACPGCADRMRGELAKDTHAAFVRALLFGVGAAIGGMILYAAFEIATGWIIGYVSLAVGWMVGTAMMKGSNGVGGRRYQIAAVLLTYAAVSMAAIPIWIHYAGKQRQAHHQQAQRQVEEQQSDSGQENPQSTQMPTAQKQTPATPRMGLGGWLVRATLLGLASPFLEVWEGGPSFSWLIGLVILFVGMRIAARITAGKPLHVYGPFSDSPQP